MPKMPKPRGFTLIELLVVISIIAILSVIGMAVYGNVQVMARDTKRREDLKAIAQALEVYKAKNSLYPIPGNNWIYSNRANDPWIPGLDPSYMASVPRDPKNTSGGPFDALQGYSYAYISGIEVNGRAAGTYFLLAALLENPNSDDKKTKCPVLSNDGTQTIGSTNSQATNTYLNTFFVCNRQ